MKNYNNNLPKFKVGDKVDFVNDYGVVFKDKTITEVESSDYGFKYQFEPTDTPWHLSYEKNFHLANTYIAPNTDLILNNGICAKFLRFTDGFSGESQKIFSIQTNKHNFNCVLVGDTLYSISSIFEEPIEALETQFQIKK